MMTWLAIITFILIVCIMAYTGHKGMLDWVGTGIIVGLLILLLSIALAHACFPERMTPMAIDVYRGHTTLQIIYKDSVAVDTIVVFKDEYIKSIKP